MDSGKCIMRQGFWTLREALGKVARDQVGYAFLVSRNHP
jgi:hypothetical protein